ncbi:MAG: VF530 family protein [Candidatus Gracilibacteria bacterium]|nr:VF530 family protein [Candidatus Gracilibacteria bacterium]MDQ7023753.1 VF530 family protein [Candidatus Gracilibacteria bacterium]
MSSETQVNMDHELLHGVTLKMILEYLVEKYGFEELDERFKINCFANNPSISSSLKFLRKTQWARTQVQGLYVKEKIYESKKNRQGASRG